jgi:hypothetical protein
MIVPNIQLTVHALTAGGFILNKAERKPGYMVFITSRYDEFGNKQNYCFALAETSMNKNQVDGAEISARHHNANLVVIGQTEVDTPKIEWNRFINIFGGPVLNVEPFEPDFGENLVRLGYNKLPNGIRGKADEVFETYVNVALEFIFGGTVKYWGQSRKFENIADGLAIPSINFTALYDAKACKKGYQINSGTIRQFNDYVIGFKSKYSDYYKLNSFIVVSGEFAQKESSLDERSHELLSLCGIPLSFLNAETLADIVKLMVKNPQFRRSINWAKIFTRSNVQTKFVKKEIAILKKDGLLRSK